MADPKMVKSMVPGAHADAEDRANRPAHREASHGAFRSWPRWYLSEGRPPTTRSRQPVLTAARRAKHRDMLHQPTELLAIGGRLYPARGGGSEKVSTLRIAV